MIFTYNCNVSIVVRGKIVETFKNKKVNNCCMSIMKQFVVMTKGYEAGTFTLLRM